MSGDSVEVTVLDHPLVADSLAVIRDGSTTNEVFRRHVDRIGTLLVAEATRTLPTVAGTVTTPLTETAAHRLAERPLVVPVLRAGLGLLGPAQALLPQADVGFIGVARDEASFQPVAYVDKLPSSVTGRPVIVLDPMLATGGSLAHAIGLLRGRGAEGPIEVVCVLAAPEGSARLGEGCGPLRLVVGAVDERLNENAFIVPGLGDAGDRLFGDPGD